MPELARRDLRGGGSQDPSLPRLVTLGVGRKRRGSGQPRCWSGSTSPSACGACRPRPSPAASSSGSTSPAASSPTARCCCSTSRPRRSTPRTAPRRRPDPRAPSVAGAAIVGIFHDPDAARRGGRPRRLELRAARGPPHDAVRRSSTNARIVTPDGRVRRHGRGAATAASPRSRRGRSPGAGGRRPRRRLAAARPRRAAHRQSREALRAAARRALAGRAGGAGARRAGRRRRHHHGVRRGLRRRRTAARSDRAASMLRHVVEALRRAQRGRRCCKRRAPPAPALRDHRPRHASSSSSRWAEPPWSAWSRSWTTRRASGSCATSTSYRLYYQHEPA